MKPYYFTILLTPLLFTSCLNDFRGTETISGRVIGTDSSESISDATVMLYIYKNSEIPDTLLEVTSDDQGEFEFEYNFSGFRSYYIKAYKEGRFSFCQSIINITDHPAYQTYTLDLAPEAFVQFHITNTDITSDADILLVSYLYYPCESEYLIETVYGSSVDTTCIFNLLTLKNEGIFFKRYQNGIQDSIWEIYPEASQGDTIFYEITY